MKLVFGHLFANRWLEVVEISTSRRLRYGSCEKHHSERPAPVRVVRDSVQCLELMRPFRTLSLFPLSFALSRLRDRHACE